MRNKYTASQLKLIPDIPSKLSMTRCRRVIHNDAGWWTDRESYLTPMYRRMKRYRGIVRKMQGKHINTVARVIHKVSKNVLPGDEILSNIVDLPDRNGEYGPYKYRKWNWLGKNQEVNVTKDLRIRVRARQPRKHHVRLTHNEWRALQRGLKAAKKQRNNSPRFANPTLGGLKVQGYTKAERFEYMCANNSLDMLLKHGILKMHGPYRLVQVSTMVKGKRWNSKYERVITTELRYTHYGNW